jgi:hypothetical protein
MMLFYYPIAEGDEGKAYDEEVEGILLSAGQV